MDPHIPRIIRAADHIDRSRQLVGSLSDCPGAWHRQESCAFIRRNWRCFGCPQQGARNRILSWHPGSAVGLTRACRSRLEGSLVKYLRLLGQQLKLKFQLIREISWKDTVIVVELLPGVVLFPRKEED